MYIQPETKVYIIKNCPLDPTYDHTLWWDSVIEQENYFSSIKKYTLNNQSYQRVQRGKIRVQIKSEDLYDCNYLMFQNTAFGNKWFYAFIKSVEYVNNITSDVTFEIDVMQTWFFNYELAQCFVQREHSTTDIIGQNTVPESLEQGPYIINTEGVMQPSNNKDIQIIMLTSFDQSQVGLPMYAGKISNGVYSGLYVGFFNNAVELNTMLQLIEASNKLDGVVGIYMCPFDETAITTYYQEDFTLPKHYGSLNGYVPKNKKLFTYPYNLLHIYTAEASSDFRYELFSGSSCTFTWRESVIPEPVLMLLPRNYAGDNGYDTESRMVSANYPQCSFNNDVYRAYLAQNQASLPLKTLSATVNASLQLGRATISGVGAALSGNAQGYVNSIYSMGEAVVNQEMQIASIMAQRHDISTKPPQVNGTQTSSADFGIRAKGFQWKNLTIRAEFARMIDDYFTMFGYATHRVKVPNRNSRPHWNYVKTVGCVLTGSIPSDDVSAICAIYNNGITFWKDPDNVGNYSLDNSPSN